ncbi:MAG: MBL fold metallo-hydrolase [Myxococcota bacterium]
MNPIFNVNENILRFSINYPELRVERPNIYLIKNKNGYLMVDCGGYNVENDYAILYKTLHATGIKPSEIKTIILTHTHKDHALLCGRLQKGSGATIILGRDDLFRISSEIGQYRDRYRDVKDYLLFWGFDSEMISRFYRSFERQYFDAQLDTSNILLLDKDIEYDSFDILCTPGHTAGSICLFDRKSKVLFSGDTLLKKIVTVPIIEYYRGMKDGLSLLSEHTRTLKRLKSLRYETLCSGHGEPIKKDIPLIDTIFSYIERRKKRVLSLIREGKNTVYKLALSLYSGDVFYDVVYKEAPVVYVSDLMMPLEALYEDNEISVKDGVIKAL